MQKYQTGMTVTTPIIKSMTREESYAERRELFKNIWKTSLQINPNDPNILNKPKVIKTLRMDEMDKFPIGKPKKERIKNLRHVCNKILEFCDKQEADDVHYQEVMRTASEKKENPDMPNKVQNTKTKNRKKPKNTARPNTEVTVARYTDIGKTKGKRPSRSQKESITTPTLPTATKRPPLTMTTRITQKCALPSKVAQTTKARNSTTVGAASSPSRGRNVKKKLMKKAKATPNTQ